VIVCKQYYPLSNGSLLVSISEQGINQSIKQSPKIFSRGCIDRGLVDNEIVIKIVCLVSQLLGMFLVRHTAEQVRLVSSDNR